MQVKYCITVPGIPGINKLLFVQQAQVISNIEAKCCIVTEVSLTEYSIQRNWIKIS